MDELDRTEEMPRNEADLSLPPLVLARAARGMQRRLALPPPLPPRAKRWTPTPPDPPPDAAPLPPAPVVARPAIPPIPIHALRRPTTDTAAPARDPSSVEEPVPSLTEELQLLTAEADPTEHDDRPEPRAPRRAWVIVGCAVVLVVIAIVALRVGGSSVESPSVRATTPAGASRELAVTTIPHGASVTLIDTGVATVVGNTPITISIEKARGYDLVLALPGHQTSVYHLAGDQLAPVTLDLRNLAVSAHRVIE